MSERATSYPTSFLEERGNGNPELKQLELPPALLNRVNMLQVRFDNPLVEMKDGVCLGCFMNQPSHHKQKVQEGDGFGICENCGRVLYWEED